MLRGDAYRFLVRGDTQYDVIASEPSNPWVTGVEMLFSREFLELAKRRLAPGGVWAQWFHVYETGDATVELVLRTYTQVFDHVAVWYALPPDLLVLGFDDASDAVDLARFEARASAPAVRAALARARIYSFPALLAHELLPIGVLHAARLEGPIHTLAKPILSHRAARAFFARGTGSMPPTFRPEPAALGAERSFLRRYASRSGGRLSEEDRATVARTVCEGRYFECMTMLAAWQHEVPVSAARDEVVARLQRSQTDRAEANAAMLPLLAELFAAPTAPVPLAHARQLTDLFARYYHHAAPFPRHVIGELWRNCVEPQGGAGQDPETGRCQRNARIAEEWIGGFGDVPAPADAPIAPAAP
jgi:hypothetical protein